MHFQTQIVLLSNLMKLLTFKTLWGHTGSIEEGAVLAKAAGFAGIEAPA
ncbi:MAG: hypothetical protein ACJA0E_000716, partial [Bermanella sp.]